MDRFDDWAVDPAINLADVRAFVADESLVGQAYLGRYLVSHTTGSSGVRALIVRDRDSLRLHSSIMSQRLPELRQVTRSPGGRTAIAAVVRTDGHHAIYSGWKFGRQGPPREGAPESRVFSIHAPVARLVEDLNAYQPSILNSSPAMLVELAQRQVSGELAIRPRMILSGSETLTVAASDVLVEAFRCPVRNIYASTEFKFIAIGCDRGWLHVNDDWVVVEPVDQNLDPVPAGTPSETVLLTDLVNRTQPLIRYVLGDRITVKPDDCECGRTLQAIRVEGRSRVLMSFTAPNGTSVPLHPSVIEGLFHDRPEIVQYQIVVKEGSALRILLRVEGGSDDHVWAALSAGLRDRLQERNLGFVRIERSSGPPVVDPNTGTVPQVIVDPS
jgi:phenylacetate-coenzyme A ligase PaaK-like adenylate-forming protein